MTYVDEGSKRVRRGDPVDENDLGRRKAARAMKDVARLLTNPACCYDMDRIERPVRHPVRDGGADIGDGSQSAGLVPVPAEQYASHQLEFSGYRRSGCGHDPVATASYSTFLAELIDLVWAETKSRALLGASHSGLRCKEVEEHPLGRHRSFDRG